MNKHIKLSPLLGGFAAIAVLTLLLVIYSLTRPVTMVGTKNISIEVAYENGIKEYYQITTEAQFLLEAINSIPDLKIEGNTSDEFGLMVTTINGTSADYQKDQAYWAILLDGEPCSYGVSKQPIKDKETYTFQYTPAKEEAAKP
jgi:hypothetical protein